MNVTFLLGNGFDLQLGMETGYKSFLKWYIQQPSKDSDIIAFREYLKDEETEWWSDAEIAMGKYLGNFNDSNLKVYYKNIRDFKLYLSKYLVEQNARYTYENEPYVIDTFIDFLIRSANDIMLRATNLSLEARRKKNDTYVNFVTFNYTDVIDRILEIVREKYASLQSFSVGNVIFKTKIGTIYHVHGTLDSSLIMGVDNYEQLDTTQITDTEKLKRTLIKPIVNDELGRDEHTEATKMISNSQYLFFYGLSFGKTDSTWWDAIRIKLVNDPSCQVVLFTRSSEGEIESVIPEDILDYVSDKRDEFMLKIGILPGSEYENVRKRVFVIRNTERLKISIDDMKGILESEKIPPEAVRSPEELEKFILSV